MEAIRAEKQLVPAFEDLTLGGGLKELKV